MTARLALGTAQFGADYGIANERGRVPRDEVGAILARAAAAQVGALDTAPSYGVAEAVLGEHRELAAPFAVVTKTLPGAGAPGVRRVLEASLLRLGRAAADALLVHDRERLLTAGGDALWGALEECVAAGLVRAIGVSVYHPEEAFALLARYPLGVVQLPLNVFDQRAWSSGLLEHLRGLGVEVHARSVFLQGLLLMDPDRLPARLRRAARPLAALHQRARDLGLSRLEAALAFVRGVPGVDLVVCGVDGVAQLEALARAWGTPGRAAELADLALEDLSLLDPSKWSAP